jgi:hypothetical protein
MLVPEDIVFQQICEMARFYSGLRFVMFTVFTTILAGVFTVEFRLNLHHRREHSWVAAFRTASVVLIIGFGALEVRVAQLIMLYQTQAYEMSSNKLVPPSRIWYWVVLVITLLPFLAALLILPLSWSRPFENHRPGPNGN